MLFLSNNFAKEKVFFIQSKKQLERFHDKHSTKQISLYMSATDDPNPISNENLMQVNSLWPSSIFILSEYGPYEKSKNKITP